MTTAKTTCSSTGRAPGKPARPYKPKVKTGCMSCRTRRVKCDEAKPSCKRCVQTGRTCDGYEDLFRPLQWAPTTTTTTPPKSPNKTKSRANKTRTNAAVSISKITPPPTPPAPSPPIIDQHPPPSPSPSPQQTLPPPPPPRQEAARPAVTREDVAALAIRFTNKQHVAGGYEDEARMSLEASLSEPAVRHAIASLTSLYKTLEDHGHGLPRGKSAIPAVYDGLQEYNNAIINLASKLSSADPCSVEVALVCCRMFMSIELMLKSYVACAKHYFRGVRIMHEAAARAHIDSSNSVVPTQNPDYPKIDVFLIKIFSAPDDLSPSFRNAARNIKRGTKLTPKQFVEIVRFARIEVRAARAKAKLVAISELVLQFLDRVARLQPGDDVERILSEKRFLVQLLESVKGEVDGRDGPGELGTYHGRFLSMFHSALWIPTYSALWPPTRDIGEMSPLFDRIAHTASRSSTDYGNVLDGAPVVL